MSDQPTGPDGAPAPRPTPNAAPNAAIDRGGHLSAWAIERLRLDDGATDPAFFLAAEAHLAACAECRAVRASMAAADDDLTLAPPASLFEAPVASAATTTAAVMSLDEARAKRRSQRWWIGGAGALLAAAATFAIVTRGPDMTAKGTRFDFEVHVHDGKSSRRVDDGARVHPGDKAGFKVRAASAGFVLIFGWDAAGDAYPAYPSRLGTAAPLAPAREVQPLASAIQFDAAGEVEHFAAVWCSGSFAFGDIAAAHIDEAALRREVAARDCVLHTVTLKKAP